MRKLLVFAVLFALGSGGAAAQSLTAFERDLLSLAGHFGTMHHLTQICENRSDQIWRDNMLELLRLENPSREQRNRMSQRFNDAYNEVEQRFPTCTGEARAYASRLAREGADLASRMAFSLR
jgi:uncharacterized protein (TIGR02301 family)